MDRCKALWTGFALFVLCLCCLAAAWWLLKHLYALSLIVADHVPAWLSQSFWFAVVLIGLCLVVSDFFAGIRNKRRERRFIARMKAQGLFRSQK